MIHKPFLESSLEIDFQKETKTILTNFKEIFSLVSKKVFYLWLIRQNYVIIKWNIPIF